MNEHSTCHLFFVLQLSGQQSSLPWRTRLILHLHHKCVWASLSQTLAWLTQTCESLAWLSHGRDLPSHWHHHFAQKFRHHLPLVHLDSQHPCERVCQTQKTKKVNHTSNLSCGESNPELPGTGASRECCDVLKSSNENRRCWPWFDVRIKLELNGLGENYVTASCVRTNSKRKRSLRLTTTRDYALICSTKLW